MINWQISQPGEAASEEAKPTAAMMLVSSNIQTNKLTNYRTDERRTNYATTPSLSLTVPPIESFQESLQRSKSRESADDSTSNGDLVGAGNLSDRGRASYQQIGSNGVTEQTMSAAQAAALATIDFRVNGGRLGSIASEDGTFVPPRWELDQEVDRCRRCTSEFDWINRKHHCRYCGKIFCGKCSSHRMLLPREFNTTDVERVCHSCNEILAPKQRELVGDIANGLKNNSIDLSDSITRYCNLPFSCTMGSEIRKAAYSLSNLLEKGCIDDKAIPTELLQTCKGIAFLTVGKCGFMYCPKLGTGLVVAKLAGNRGWSAPSAIWTAGFAWGLNVGVEVTDYIIILQDDAAVESFTGTMGNLTIGIEADVAVGPIGRSGSGGLTLHEGGASHVISYSHTRGVFVGLALDGTIIMPRPDVNHNFYGVPHTAYNLLTGRVPTPNAAKPLYDVLASTFSFDYNQPTATQRRSINVEFNTPSTASTATRSEMTQLNI